MSHGICILDIGDQNQMKVKMWMCRMLIKIVTAVADDLYNLYTISFILSMGTIRESLQLIDMMDEEDSFNV